MLELDACQRLGFVVVEADSLIQALELAEAADDVHALAQAHNMLSILARNQGDLDLARHHLERSLALAETLNDPGAEVAETALARCTFHGDRHRQAALHSNLDDLLQAAGQREAAMTHLKRAGARFCGDRPRR